MIDLSTMTNFEIAALVGGILSLIGGLVYIPPILGRDMLWRKTATSTQPIPTTWLTWSIVGAMTIATYYESGARATVLIAVGLFLEYSIVTIVSLVKKGLTFKHFTSLKLLKDFFNFSNEEIASLLGVVVSAGLWVITGNPLIALVLIIVTDMFGAWLTIKRTYYEPHEEPIAAWMFTFAADLFGLLAVELWAWSWDSFAIYSLIVYWTIANGFILILALRPTIQAFFAPQAKSSAK